eukprot:scaffold4.g4927.t1
MNPLGTWLGADPGRFTCATAVDGRLLGFGQARRAAGDGGPRAAPRRAPASLCARPPLPPRRTPPLLHRPLLPQLKEIQGGEAVELSSLVVAPEARGAGIGTQLIADLARRAAGRDVWATTIGTRTALYERSGFQEVPLSQAPTPGLLFECLVGAAVAALAARDRLALLRRRGGGDGGEGGSAAAARQEAERRAAGG